MQHPTPNATPITARRLKSVFQPFLLALLTLCASNALAWGKVGHQVVSSLAATQLSKKARAEVDRLLALEPGATLESISTWADEHRNPATANWHYLNFPRGNCTFDAERDCPDGGCVVAAIDKQLKILKSSSSDESKLKALKYVVHFVADVHQPLHAGFGDDRGGNKYQLQAFGKGTNLHALWDSGLIHESHDSAEMMVKKLLGAQQAGTAIDLSVVHAAEESCKIVSMPEFYPSRHLEKDYVDRFTRVMEQRLSIAGARLAGLLNRAFE